MGYALGFSGSAILGVALLIAALLLFPPARANILLLGVDRRPDETTWATRTDTMMLTTLAPPTPYVGLLSIPRDLYVQLPSGDWNRINTAHFFAEAYAPGTGPQAAMQTAQNNFGVDVHHYARVDLMGFVRIVEAMGGIEIEVPEALFDDAYPTDDYGTTTISFAPGQQHMDGEQALAYARSRHYSSDFDRAARQQLVLQAIAAQLLRPATWPRWPKILAALAQSVETDITPVEALRFAPLLIQFSPAQWDRRVIEGALVQPFTTEGGAAVQQPVWDQINPVLMEMFGQ
jgi:LCP family protein required for cell wall assembly